MFIKGQKQVRDPLNLQEVTDYNSQSRIESGYLARKRVQDSLNISQRREKSPEPGPVNIHVDQHLAKQMKGWKDMPLIEKSKLIILQQDLKKTDRLAQQSFAFKPELNPFKETRFTYVLDSKTDITVQTGLYSLETDEDYVQKAMKIILQRNKQFLKQLFKYLVGFRNSKFTEKQAVSLPTLTFVLKQIDFERYINVNECKTLIQRIKNETQETKDAQNIDADEFKLFLIQISDIIGSKWTGDSSSVMDSSTALISLLTKLKTAFGSRLPKPQALDQDIIEYLEHNRPETLPLVRLSLILELRVCI